MAEFNTLTDEIMTQVIYGMENQKVPFVFDQETGELRAAVKDDTGIPLPPWGPSDGFQLMERFAANRPDPVVRSRLSSALESGQGVFRKFKNALADHPGQENLWFRYKKAEMRRTAISWFSRWSDALRLEDLGEEPENLEDLTLTDFQIRSASQDDESILRIWDNDALADAWKGWPTAVATAADQTQRGNRERNHEDDVVLISIDPSGTSVGYVWLVLEESENLRWARFLRLYVSSGYRGLGLGEGLVKEAMAEGIKRGAKSFGIMTGPGAQHMERFLERSGFAREATYWRSEKTLARSPEKTL